MPYMLTLIPSTYPLYVSIYTWSIWQMKPAANCWSIPASFLKPCNYGLKPKIPHLEDKPAPSGGCSAHIRISVSSRKHTGHDWSETSWSISRSKIKTHGNLMVIIMGMYGNTMGYIYIYMFGYTTSNIVGQYGQCHMF